jgi:hypothetical protein
VNIVAGRDVNLLARQNINLTAVTQAIRLRAQTALMGFCAAGNILWEVVAGFWHRWIGPLTANNTFTVLTPGIVNAETSVLTPLVIATTINGGAINGGVGNVTTLNASVINATDTFSENGYSQSFSLSLTIPDVALTMDSNTDKFQYQSDYGVGTLYQTITQQMLKQQDAALTNTITWTFVGNADAGRGSPWPGAGIQEMTTNAGDKLSTPSSNTHFSEKPQTLKQQAPTMLVQ